MIEIRKLMTISIEGLSAFGKFGYISNFKYGIIRRESSQDVSFSLKLTKLDKPFLKEWKDFVPSNEIINKFISDGNSFGAYDGDQLIGFVIAEKRSWNKSLWIEMLQIAEAYKRKGIGSSLLSEAEKLAERNNVRIVDIETQNTNVSAVNFYKKNGYDITGLNTALYDPEIIKDETAIFMAKKLK